MTKNSAAPVEVLDEAAPIRKTSRHVAIATKHLLAQRDKAVMIRNRAADEVKELEDALAALGWSEE